MNEPYTIDFIEYWTAYRLLRDGTNGYDATHLFNLQHSINPHLLEAKMYWSPPWLLTIISPILELPYETASIVWLCLNIIFWLAITLLLTKNASINKIWVIVSCLLCFPALDVTRLGQSGLLIALALTCFLKMLASNHMAKAGAFIPLLCIKPHLFILPMILLCIRVKSKGFWVGLLTSSLVLVILTELLMPKATLYWLATLNFHDTATLSTPRITYYTSTFNGLVRSIFPLLSSYSAYLMAIPLTISILLGVKWARHAKPDLVRIFYCTLPLSLFLAPYGWLHDCATLLPLHAKIGENNSSKKYLSMLVLAVTQIIIYIQPLYISSYAYTAWYPLAIYVAFVLINDRNLNIK